MPLVLLISLALAVEQAPPFPERFPAMMEACIQDAIDHGEASTTDDSYKYICQRVAASAMWAFLDAQNIKSWEQDAEGATWLSRDFPLGGCFKQVRRKDGASPNGLSCTIWIPRIPSASKSDSDKK